MCFRDPSSKRKLKKFEAKQSNSKEEAKAIDGKEESKEIDSKGGAAPISLKPETSDNPIALEDTVSFLTLLLWQKITSAKY